MKRLRRRWRPCCRFRGSISRSLWRISKKRRLGTTKAEPPGSALLCAAMFCNAILSDWSDCSPAADEVHDDGDHGEEEQEVNEEAAHVQEEESAQPEQNQHNSQNEKHE